MAADLSNLGHVVTTRNYSWSAMVIPEWGEQWGQRQVEYRMSNGRMFLDDDNTLLGIYGIEMVDGWITRVLPLAYGDMVPPRLLAETGQMIGFDNPPAVGYPIGANY